MAKVEARLPSGLSLTVELYPYGSDDIANSGGDTLTEQTNRKGLYQATIAESLTGWHTAHIKQGSAVIAIYDVYMTSSSGVHRCEEAPAQAYAGGVGVNLDDDAIQPSKIEDGALSSNKFTVAALTGVAEGILERLDQVWRSIFKKSTKTSEEIKTYADDGETVLTTQEISDDETTQTRGEAT